MGGTCIVLNHPIFDSLVLIIQYLNPSLIIWYQFTLLALFSIDLFLTFLSSYGEFLPQQGKMTHNHLLKRILLNTNPRIKFIESNGMKILPTYETA